MRVSEVLVKLSKPNRDDFRSGFEYTLATQLFDAGIDFKYEIASYNYFLKIPNAFCEDCGSKEVYTEKSYTPDFFLPNGIIIEAKGKFTSDNRKKHKALKELHPEIDVRIVFMRDNWLTKTHTIKCSTWCEQEGIDYSIGRIPPEWLV